MDNNQELLISLLSAAIRGKNPSEVNWEDANWEYILQDAKAHEVHTLLYPVLKILKPDKGSGKQTLLKWRKLALLSGTAQAIHIERIGTVLNCLNSEKIPVIALKGLVLRELYPNPELRTMGDADLFVHTEDLERAKDLLLTLKYSEQSKDNKHIHFSSHEHLPIELHKRLTDKKNLKNAKAFEAEIWENAVTSNVCGVPALVLSPTDQLLYLCIHMFNHFMYCGFGLRQLCDFVLLAESIEDESAWNYFHSMIENFGIGIFVHYILILCQKFFDMKIQYYNSDKFKNNDALLEEFAEDIFSGGIFGFRNCDRYMACLQLQYIKSKYTKFNYSNFKKLLRLLFPMRENLEGTYLYCKDNSFLIPVAWLHRIVRETFRKDFTLTEKTALLFSNNALNYEFEKRSKLLHRLGLM